MRSLLSQEPPDPSSGEFEGFAWNVVSQLSLLRENSSSEWTQLASLASTLPLAARFRESPLSARSALKPRGYAGDAPMLDFIYKMQPASLETSEFGRFWMQHELCYPACRGARDRLKFAAQCLERVARFKPGARVLSLAAGHCRELDLLAPGSLETIERIDVVDQDQAALEHVSNRWNGCVVTKRQNIMEFLREDPNRPQYDFIYALGLFDYLSGPSARRLVANCSLLLRPGGELLVGNYTPGLVERGYMESIMDWWLIYRDEAAMTALASECGQDITYEVFRDPLGAIVYLRIQRA